MTVRYCSSAEIPSTLSCSEGLESLPPHRDTSESPQCGCCSKRWLQRSHSLSRPGTFQNVLMAARAPNRTPCAADDKASYVGSVISSCSSWAESTERCLAPMHEAVHDPTGDGTHRVLTTTSRPPLLAGSVSSQARAHGAPDVPGSSRHALNSSSLQPRRPGKLLGSSDGQDSSSATESLHSTQTEPHLSACRE